MALGSFLRVAVSIATALAKLNKRGLVHQDLRPTHILVNRADQQVRLSGYGVAFAPAARAPEDDAARTKPRRTPVTKWRALAAAYRFCQYFEQWPQPYPSLNAPDSFNAAYAGRTGRAGRFCQIRRLMASMSRIMIEPLLSSIRPWRHQI